MLDKVKSLFKKQFWNYKAISRFYSNELSRAKTLIETNDVLSISKDAKNKRLINKTRVQRIAEFETILDSYEKLNSLEFLNKTSN